MEQILIAGVASGVACLCYAVHRYLYEKPSLKEYDHPYKEPGYCYGLKCILFWINEVLFRKTEQRFNNHDPLSKDPTKVGIFPFELHEKLEGRQNVQSADDMDETSFMGVNPKTGNVLNVSIAKRKGDQCEAVISYVVTEDGKRKEFELPQLPRTLTRSRQSDGNCWTCDDLKIWNLRSLSRWRISFNGLMREKTSKEISYIVFNFVWAPYSCVIDHKYDIAPITRAKAFALSGAEDLDKDLDNILDQYDQWGSFCGQYAIDDGPETEIFLFGSKCRRTGQLSLSSMHRFIQIKGYVEDGSTFTFNAINIPDRVPEMNWGYVELAAGFRHLITSSDFDLLRLKEMDSLPVSFSIRFKTDCDEYVLDLKCANGNFTHLWGPQEELKSNCNNLTVCLTSLFHGIRLKGAGLVQFMSKNDLKLEPPKCLPPLLEEPAVVGESASAKNILEFSEESCKSSMLVGGKGSSLAMLKQIKSSEFEVPDGLCITVSANNKHIKANGKVKEQIQRISNVCCGKIQASTEDECKSLAKLFLESEISQKFTEELRQKMASLFGEKFEEMSFSVRSSAIGEDGEDMSAAGQMETILGCKGVEQILGALKKCWASCFGFRAVEYRRQNGQLIDVGMGVVVQVMVAADKAGVLFTRDPVNANPAVISIAANYGIGESVVSALSEPDTIVVKRTFDNQLSLGDISIGKKKLQIKMKEDGSVEETEITETDSATCCLSKEEAIKLAELGLLVEQSYGNPRDIEWAIYKGKFYLLQARPITNLHSESDHFLTNELNTAIITDSEWSTSGNIKEVFPGAQSTLSSSLTLPYFMIIFAQLGRSFGVTKPHNPFYCHGFTHTQTHLFSNRSNLIHSNNMKISENQKKQLIKIKKGMDVAFNGRIIEDQDLQTKCLIRNRYNKKISMVLQLISHNLVKYSAKRKQLNVKKAYEKFELSMDHCKTNEELAHSLKTCFAPYAEALTGHGYVTMTSMASNADVLLELLGKAPEFQECHYGDFALLLGIDSGNAVESADVPSALQVLGKEIVKNSDFEKFLQMSNEEGVKFLASDGSPVKECYRNFIKRHGHRCVKEFDIQSKTWAMEPSKLIAPIQAIIRSRHNAEPNKLTIDEALGRLKTEMTDKQRKSLRKKVLTARDFVGLREDAKSILIKTVDQYRKQWRKFAQKLVSEGRLPDEELLFFMTPEEIEELVKTRSAKIIQRAMRRKRLHPKLEKLRFKEICVGPPKPIDDVVAKPNQVDGCLVIKGTPVSRGIIEGPVKVVPHVEEAHTIQPGDILVTNATDIAWSPYFPSLSGVITEIGGLISHGAVVAREYGIPCVVGAANATVHLKSGDKIRLNGNDGSITVLPS